MGFDRRALLGMGAVSFLVGLGALLGFLGEENILAQSVGRVQAPMKLAWLVANEPRLLQKWVRHSSGLALTEPVMQNRELTTTVAFKNKSIFCVVDHLNRDEGRLKVIEYPLDCGKIKVKLAIELEEDAKNGTVHFGVILELAPASLAVRFLLFQGGSVLQGLADELAASLASEISSQNAERLKSG